MNNFLLILLAVALAYMLGELRAYARCLGHQKQAIAAQDKAIAAQKRAEAFMRIGQELTDARPSQS